MIFSAGEDIVIGMVYWRHLVVALRTSILRKVVLCSRAAGMKQPRVIVCYRSCTFPHPLRLELYISCSVHDPGYNVPSLQFLLTVSPSS